MHVCVQKMGVCAHIWRVFLKDTGKGAKMAEKKERQKPIYQWEEARLLYVTTGASCGQVAEKIGKSRGAVEAHCAAEGWVAQRRQFRKNLYKRALERAEKTGLTVLGNLMTSAETLAGKLVETVQDPEAFHRFLVSEKSGGMKQELVFRKTDMEAVRSTVQALKGLAEVVRDLWGIPGVKQEESRRLAEARLALMQQRYVDAAEEKVVVEIVGGEDWQG